MFPDIFEAGSIIDNLLAQSDKVMTVASETLIAAVTAEVESLKTCMPSLDNSSPCLRSSALQRASEASQISTAVGRLLP